MRVVELRDIVTDADRAAALALRVAPGQEAFVATVETSLHEAQLYPEARARYWAVYDRARIVGFAMLSDGIPAAVLAEDPTLVGPYFLWRLLIDERYQRLGYGSATMDALVAYLRDRPGADALLVSCGQGEGSPCPFYERYGFVRTGQVHEGEVVLRLDLTGARPSVATLGT
jgi:diamine N-acetyltransferase